MSGLSVDSYDFSAQSTVISPLSADSYDFFRTIDRDKLSLG